MKRLAPIALALTGLLVLAGCSGPNLFDRVGSFWGYGLCSAVVVILDVVAILEIAGKDWTFGRKLLWALLIVFFPVGGLLLYWFFAR